MENQITTLENLTITTAVDVFVDSGLDPYLQQITEEVKTFIPDVSTAKGRKSIASMAMKVAKSKTFLDGLGKDLNAEAKKKAKVVDNERKRCREYLDALRDEVRAPLNEYEEKQKQSAQEQLEKYEALKELTLTAGWDGHALSSEKLNDLIIELKTIVVDESYGEYELQSLKAQTKGLSDLKVALDSAIHEEEKEAQEKLEAQERERLLQIEREKAIADAAKKEAEAKAEEEAERKRIESDKAIADAEKAKKDAIEAEKAAEIRAKEAAEKANQDKINAEEQARKDAELAALKAEQDKQQAIEAERRRQVEEEARLKKEAEAREANTKHKTKINNAALNAIVNASGVSSDDAKKIVIAINKGRIPNITIHY